MVGCKDKYGEYRENNNRMRSLLNAIDGIFYGV
jgi:hypothetical protein